MSGTSHDYRDAAEDFREQRELCGLGDSDGLGCDPTLEPPSLAYSRIATKPVLPAPDAEDA